MADVEARARPGARPHWTPRPGTHGEARVVIETLVARVDGVYGVTTGSATWPDLHPARRRRRLQENLLVSHAAGVGRPFPREVVRAMLLLRANTLALGHSGCRPLLVDRICRFLELGIHPVVPEQGSVGASGDLAPLAHLALPLIGRWEVELGGQAMPALVALREVGLEPLALESKEGWRCSTDPSDERAGALLLADADRLCRPRRCGGDVGGGAAGTEVAYGAVPSGEAPPGAGPPCRGALSPAAWLRLQHAHHGSGTMSRTRTRCAACPRSTARFEMPSTTCAASWTWS